MQGYTVVDRPPPMVSHHTVVLAREPDRMLVHGGQVLEDQESGMKEGDSSSQTWEYHFKTQTWQLCRTGDPSTSYEQEPSLFKYHCQTTQHAQGLVYEMQILVLRAPRFTTCG